MSRWTASQVDIAMRCHAFIGVMDHSEDVREEENYYGDAPTSKKVLFYLIVPDIIAFLI